LLGEVISEVVTVVDEQVDGVLESVHRVTKLFVNQFFKVKLLVSPVDFKKTLEALDKHLRLFEGAVHDELNALVLGFLDDLVGNPALGVEEDGLGLFPLSLHVVPLFQGISVVLQVLVLTPASEALNRLKPRAEGLEHTINEVFLFGH